MDDLTLDLRSGTPADTQIAVPVPSPQLTPYTPERQQQQRDWVRMIFTVAVFHHACPDEEWGGDSHLPS